MSRFVFVDESGTQSDYVFAAILVNNTKIPEKIVKDWRLWMKRRLKSGFTENEYKDSDAKQHERKKMLQLISRQNISIGGVLKYDYMNNHKELYVPTIVELLKHCGIDETDCVIALDQIGAKKDLLAKYIRLIKKEIGMPNLSIDFGNSQELKGLQIADAVAGCFRRHTLLGLGNEDSFYNLIEHQLIRDIKRII
ncbi:MAG: DUF3800 domain-containing protein [Bacillota bacterium]|jgi:hypothetical protein